MIVSIVAFNEAKMLPMCLGHLPRGTAVEIIDGAYADFPHDDPQSTDGSLDMARRWGAKVRTVTRAWRDQMEKRTAQLTPGEVVFLLDADELLHTALPELPEDADVGWVTVYSHMYDGPCLIPRVFRVREGWHFAGRHHWVFDADGELVASHTFTGDKYKHAILPVFIDNARDLRGEARESRKSQYRLKRDKAESLHPSERGFYVDRAPEPQA